MPSTMAAVRAPEKKKRQTTTTGAAGYACRVILFNDNVHTFEEVATQLMKAISCSYTRGIGFANAVHNLGSAVVYSGHFERCEAVAMVLQEIKLRVTIER